MPALLNHIDPDGLEEFSVVFSDRSLNHMSASFQTVMRDLSSMLKAVYHASAVALIPGGGTYAMESVARQFCQDQKVLVVRNGWFSYRWSQIFESASLSSELKVLKAQRVADHHQAAFMPPNLDEVLTEIRRFKPAVVFAPHVETSAGMILDQKYITAMAEAAHEVGALMVLDCIASGCIWVDMQKTGVDVVISAPQKGWSSSPSAGLVMLSQRAEKQLEQTSSNSFALDLKKWRSIQKAYEDGGHAYHATMPTDALRTFRDHMKEAQALGFDKLQEAQWTLGQAIRNKLNEYGIQSVAAKNYESPSVIVYYTDDPTIHNGSKFVAQGVQIAAGVPLACDEPSDFKTFRIGLFGIDKLTNVPLTIERLTRTLETVLS